MEPLSLTPKNSKVHAIWQTCLILEPYHPSSPEVTLKEWPLIGVTRAGNAAVLAQESALASLTPIKEAQVLLRHCWIQLRPAVCVCMGKLKPGLLCTMPHIMQCSIFAGKLAVLCWLLAHSLTSTLPGNHSYFFSGMFIGNRSISRSVSFVLIVIDRFNRQGEFWTSLRWF